MPRVEVAGSHASLASSTINNLAVNHIGDGKDLGPVVVPWSERAKQRMNEKVAGRTILQKKFEFEPA